MITRAGALAGRHGPVTFSRGWPYPRPPLAWSVGMMILYAEMYQHSVAMAFGATRRESRGFYLGLS